MQSGFGKTRAGNAGGALAYAFALCSHDGTVRQIMFSRQVLRA